MLWLRNFDNAEDAGPKVHAELSKNQQNADLRAEIKAFDHAYANSGVEKYFSFCAGDATDNFQRIGSINHIFGRTVKYGD